MESTNQKVSDNELDYIEFIYYYKKGVIQSEKFLPYLADNHLEVRVVDVDNIPVKPPWLVGVPTVVVNPRKGQVEEFQLLTGTLASNYIVNWVKNKLDINRKTYMQEIDPANPVNGSACKYSEDLFTMNEEGTVDDPNGKYMDNPKSKLGSSSLEDYCRARGQSLQKE